MAEIKDYECMIKKAITKEELRAISYKAMLDSDNKIWDKVIEICIKRESELGIR